MKPLTKNSRQAIKRTILILILFGGFYLQNGLSQKQKAKIDYSKKSNILDPDTLKGDQKKIFWHFVKLTHKETKKLKPLEIKKEFEKLGITTEKKKRFQDAYSFFKIEIIFHKKSCDQWSSFKELEPKSK